jgi:hypothetical protein
MAIEIGTDAVEYFAGELVLFPLFRIEIEDLFVHEIDAILKWKQIIEKMIFLACVLYMLTSCSWIK